jgi:hypothetical protein
MRGSTVDVSGWTDPEVADMVAQLARQQADVEQARQDVEAMLVKGGSRGHEVVATMRGTGDCRRSPSTRTRYAATTPTISERW